MLIDYDDYLDVLFLYWVEDPTAYEHDDFFNISGVSELSMIYIYVCACLCLLWTLKHIIDEMFCVEQKALEHMSTYIFVEQEALEHMSNYICVE